MADTRAPRLLDLRIPRTVDLTPGVHGFTVGFTATDDASGVEIFRIGFASPVTGSSQRGGVQDRATAINRTDFSIFVEEPVIAVSDSATLWMSTKNRPGVYRISYAILEDAAGNEITYSAQQLAALGVRTSFTMLAPSYPRGSDLPDRIVGNAKANFIWGEAGDDRLFGGGGRDELDGGPGADRLFGGAGADLLIGMAGDDLLYGGAGNDRLDGGEGADRLFGGAGDRLTGFLGDDLLDGGAGNDWLGGDAGTDVLRGGVGDDVYEIGRRAVAPVVIERAGEGYDRVLASISFTLPKHVERIDLVDGLIDATGNSGDNVLQGNGYGNVLDGGAGDDRIFGDRRGDIGGMDTLIGGIGQDRMTGGGHVDFFLFRSGAESPAAAPDTITDFRGGFDAIDVSSMTDRVFFIGGAGFSGRAGEFRFAAARLSADLDGDGAADFAVKLPGLAVFDELDIFW